MSNFNIEFTSGDILEVSLDSGGLVTLGKDQNFNVTLGEVSLSPNTGFTTAALDDNSLVLTRTDGSKQTLDLSSIVGRGGGSGQTTIFPNVDINKVYAVGDVFAYDGALFYIRTAGKVPTASNGDTWDESNYRDLIISDTNRNSNVELLTVDTFTDLEDTPNSYAGKAGHATVVNADETGLELTPVAQLLDGKASVDTEQRTVYHDPKRIAGTASDPLHKAIEAIESGSGAVYRYLC